MKYRVDRDIFRPGDPWKRNGPSRYTDSVVIEAPTVDEAIRRAESDRPPGCKSLVAKLTPERIES